MAQGEYIGFVDSDDIIENNMYERMYNEAQLTDSAVVMCDAVTVYSDIHKEVDSIIQLPETCTIEKSDWTPKLLKEMAGSSWRCIYSKDLIQHHDVRFPVGLKFSEDRVFNIYMFGYANKVRYIKESFYNRIIWTGSAVHRFHKDYFEAAKYAAICTEQALFKAWNNNQEYQREYKEHFITASLGAINNYFYKTSTLTMREKYSLVKALCNDQLIQKALDKNLCGGIRGKWIKNKRVLLLCICSIYLNIKNRR